MITTEDKNILQSVYDDPENGYPSAKKLHELVRKHGITFKQVSEFLKGQDTAQLYTTQKKIQPIPIDAPDDCYQADLAFYSQYKKQNSGYSVLLCLIEITSRKAFVYSLKSKESDEILRGMNEFFSDVSRPPIRIYSDPGSEFKSKSFNQLLKKHKTEHIEFQSKEHNNLGIVDRFVRTLREKIEKYMDNKGDRRYVSGLKSLVSGYNKTPHSSLSGLTPNEVFEDDNAREVIHDEKAAMTADARDTQLDLKIGQLVRLAATKNVFSKGTRRKFSKELYRVVGVSGYRYQIEGEEDGEVEDRLYSRRELLPVPEGSSSKKRAQRLEDDIAAQQKHVRRIKKSGVVDNKKEAEKLVETKRVTRSTAPKKREVKRTVLEEDLLGLDPKTGRRYQARERRGDYSYRPSLQEAIEALGGRPRRKNDSTL